MINPSLNQTGSRDIIVTIADFMRGPEKSQELQVIRAQFLQHLLRCDTFLIVVFKALVARNIADRPKARASDFASALRNRVRHRKRAVGLRVEQNVTSGMAA